MSLPFKAGSCALRTLPCGSRSSRPRRGVLMIDLHDWLETCAARPAVARGSVVGRELLQHDGPDAEGQKIPFGRRAR
jgi:hypothetical protein